MDEDELTAAMDTENQGAARGRAAGAGRMAGAITDRVADQVSLACAPRPPGFRRGGARNTATPPHPQRHPCRRGAGLRRPGHCPPGTAPPPDRCDVRAAVGLSPVGHAQATPLGIRCDPRLRHGQRRGFWDPRLESGSPTTPARPATTFRQVALARLCRARRVPGLPRLAPVETPSAIHNPIAPWSSRARSAAHYPGGRGIPLARARTTTVTRLGQADCRSLKESPVPRSRHVFMQVRACVAA